MGSLYRRSDILGIVRLLRDRLSGTTTRWVSMPLLDYSLMVKDGKFDKTGFPVLEGGDVIVLGKKIFVGTSANSTTGSSERGYLWLKNYLEPQGYDVERVRLPEDILHLDVALSVPKPGLIIVCPEAFVDGIPSYFKDWKRIEVTKDETRYLATNGLPLDQKNYIMGVNGHFNDKRISKELKANGIKVYKVFFESHTKLGGSIRCSTMPTELSAITEAPAARVTATAASAPITAPFIENALPGKTGKSSPVSKVPETSALHTRRTGSIERCHASAG